MSRIFLLTCIALVLGACSHNNSSRSAVDDVILQRNCSGNNNTSSSFGKNPDKIKSVYHLLGLSELDMTQSLQVIDIRPPGSMPSFGDQAFLLKSDCIFDSNSQSPGRYLPPMKMAVNYVGLDPRLPTLIVGDGSNMEDFKYVAETAYSLEIVGFKNILILRRKLSQEDQNFINTLKVVNPHDPNLLRPENVPQSFPDSYVLTEDVEKIISDKSFMLLDSRYAEMYLGSDKADVVSKYGHIPGARSFPFTTYFTTSNNFLSLRSSDELAMMMESLGFQKTSGPVAYCNTGPAGILGYLVSKSSGFEDAKFYNAGMAEWANDNGHQIIKYKWE